MSSAVPPQTLSPHLSSLPLCFFPWSRPFRLSLLCFKLVPPTPIVPICCHPVCRLLLAILLCSSTTEGPSPSVGVQEAQSKQTAQHQSSPQQPAHTPNFPFPSADNERSFLQGKQGLLSFTPHGWVAALSELLFCLPSFPLKENWRNRKAETFCWKSRAKPRTILGHSIKNHGTKNYCSDANCGNALKIRPCERWLPGRTAAPGGACLNS